LKFSSSSRANRNRIRNRPLVPAFRPTIISIFLSILVFIGNRGNRGNRGIKYSNKGRVSSSLGVWKISSSRCLFLP
jgi:hypothetical protein